MKFLVSGLGSIGLRHAKNLLALGHEVYGEDIDDAKIVEAENYGVSRFSPSGHLLEKIEAAIIASPTSEHAKQLGFAISMGWHCLVEKPIAGEYEIGLELVLALAKKKNLVVMVGNNQRFRTVVQHIKENLPEIGAIHCAMFTLSQRNVKYGDHVISNWGAHELDLALYLLGPAKVVACAADPYVADIVLLHESGCQSNIHLDYFGNPETREFIIVGNRGRTRRNLLAEDTIRISYIDEMQAFINHINGKEDPVGATGEDGLETLKLITAAMEMAK